MAPNSPPASTSYITEQDILDDQFADDDDDSIDEDFDDDDDSLDEDYDDDSLDEDDDDFEWDDEDEDEDEEAIAAARADFEADDDDDDDLTDEEKAMAEKLRALLLGEDDENVASAEVADRLDAMCREEYGVAEVNLGLVRTVHGILSLYARETVAAMIQERKVSREESFGIAKAAAAVLIEEIKLAESQGT